MLHLCDIIISASLIEDYGIISSACHNFAEEKLNIFNVLMLTKKSIFVASLFYW